jgi:peptide/nickel transport system permease protein
MAAVIDTSSATQMPAAAAPRAPARSVLKRLFRDKPLGATGGLVLLFMLVVGICADLVAPFGYNEINMLERLQSPSWTHWFGTDNLGRDVMSRCIYGARLSVIIGCSAALLSTVISILIGVTSGYWSGRFDMVMQRFVDAWMSFPGLIILIVVVSVFGPGMPQTIITLGVLLGIDGSRIVRSAVVAVRENMYVHAAQSLGASSLRILWKHILPNVMPVVIVIFTTRVGTVILAESGLAFLGLGVPPPAPTWGGMLSGSGRTYMFQGPWLALAPGLCLTVMVYATNVFGDALRDLLDPRMRGSR